MTIPIHRLSLLFATGALPALVCLTPPAVFAAPAQAAARSPDPAYVKEIDSWHEKRVERLKSPGGWLAVVDSPG